MAEIALLLGGTGLVGRRLLDLLITEKHWDRINAATRRSLNVGSAKVVEVLSDAEQIARAMSQIAMQAHQGVVVHKSDQLSAY